MAITTASRQENGGLASGRVRERMVARVQELGVRDGRVLQALRAVPRHLFVDGALASRAYEDCALPIGFGQTISQPYIVARTAELALAASRRTDPKQMRVLDVGTGSGYAAAVLAQIFGTVISIERRRALHDYARNALRTLRIANLRLVFGDGMLGVPSEAPFDAVVSAAATPEVPTEWARQLALGGRIVAPIGTESEQMLTVLVKHSEDKLAKVHTEPVRFVPLRPGTA